MNISPEIAVKLLETLRRSRPFVAYAYSQGIDGAEEAGHMLDVVRTTFLAELAPGGRDVAEQMVRELLGVDAA